MLRELNKFNNKWNKKNNSKIQEATVYAQSAGSERYTIKLRNGATVGNIPGPFGLKIGDSITISEYPGQTGRYIILSKGHKGKENITIVKV